MRKLFIIACLILIAASIHARGIQEDYRKADEKKRLSYAFGMLYGSNLSTTGLEFDYAAFAEGIRVMMENGEPIMSEYEAMEIIETALHYSMERMADESRRQEEEFLIRNSRRPEIQITPSGLQYHVLREAEGDKPGYNSVVIVNYVGTFVDGNMFDMSEEGGAYIPLDMVIPGWAEGLMLMSIGSSYRFYIPSNLAYGRSGIQNVIPPYSTLIFNVELLDIIENEWAYDFWDNYDYYDFYEDYDWFED